MATEYKVLGQVNPAATTLTTLYTVPSGKDAVVSSITVATLEASDPASFRIAIRPAGASILAQHYIAYGVDLYAKTAQTLTLGVTLNEGDVVSVWASTANLAFSAFGAEVAP